MVSVVIPTKNRPKLLGRAINSVIGQTYGDFECIVVDDGSDIPASRVLKRFDDPRVRCIRYDTSRGASAARNSGIRASSGRYIAFLDDDDEWIKTKLEKQVDLIKKLDESVGLIHCWMLRINDETGEVVNSVKPELRGEIFEKTLARQPLGNVSCWLVRRPVLRELNGFDESLPRGNDGDFLRRLCLSERVDYVPQVLVRYHLEHERQQITRSDCEGIRNAITGQKVKLEKFETQLAKLPRQRSKIHSQIAYRYGQLHEWTECLHHFWIALRTDLFSLRTYYDVYRIIVSLIGK
ncbi:glycosyltransferase family 2 protein [Salinibacter sp.]|uniref:glycosyltransferase family 2 protein n=1 Tax=Salinibacter sp. TaxID=2065818 RepID=UPI0021E87A72|nr:glycosyltransferase family 2 protein [Salinibacter sp.]